MKKVRSYVSTGSLARGWAALLIALALSMAGGSVVWSQALDCCAPEMSETTFVPTQVWMLFSFPALPEYPTTFFSQSQLEDDLGPRQAAFWLGKMWDAGTGQFYDLTQFDVGRGFFLYDRVGSVGDSTEVDIYGGTQDLTYPFVLASLDSGWQELGNPYLMDLHWTSDIMVTGPGPVTVSLDSAVTLGWISPVLYTLNLDQTWEFFFVEDGDGVIPPWRGGLVLPRVEGLSLEYPPVVTAPAGGHTASASYLWRIELTANAPAEGLTDDNNHYGLMVGSSAEYDLYDVLNPPFPGDHLDLSFDDSGWATYPGDYQQDIRPEIPGIEVWPANVVFEGNSGVTVDITWSGVGSVPADIALLLVDPAMGDTVDMRLMPSYSIVTGASGDPYPLQLVVDGTGASTTVPGVGRAVPTTFTLDQNQPNPFNPVTEVRFGVPAPGADVLLAVYNVRGQVVRELWRGSATPGYHTVTWNGRDVNGQEVESGLYFYRLETSDFQETRKMTLLK